MLTVREIEEIVRRVVAHARPERVILFGSYAKGTATIHSDLDLLVVKDTPLPLEKRADDLLPVVGGSPVPIDVHVYTPEEVSELAKEDLSFIATVLAVGRVMFAR